MSGHSRWSQIKRQKEVADQKKGQLFSKLSKVISIAARRGADPEMNMELKNAIEKAREANMPKENIERAIKRGTGELAGEHIDELIYEGFGPGGVAFLMEVTTTNKNRSASDIKHVFTKYGGNLGSTNSVRRMFEKRGTIGLRSDTLTETRELKLIETGVLDIQKDGDETTILTALEDLQKIKDLLEKEGIHLEFSEFDYIPEITISIEDPHLREKLEKLSSELDEIPDISHFTSNLKSS